jgi:hypothetical protein
VSLADLDRVLVELAALPDRIDALSSEVAELRAALATPRGEPRLSRQQLAEAWGVSTRHVAAMVARGMPELRIGDAPRYVQTECEKWLREQRAEPIAAE